MDTFKKINWHPALEDMIDTVFVRDERMYRESAMYKIMSDNFMDPFEGIEDEYAQVNMELIKRLGGIELEKEVEEVQHEIKAENINENNTQSTENTIKEQDYPKNEEQKLRAYIPGIRKLPFYFPRRSHLSKSQHAMCLHVLLRFTSNENRIITEAEQIELQNYISLKDIISKEQTEFLNFAKSKWDETTMLFMKCPGFVTSKWEMKIGRLQIFPKYYAECTNIPFSMQKDVNVKFVCCLQQESLSEIELPKLDQRTILNVTTSMLHKRFKLSPVWPDENTHFVSTSVSEDTYCESLAINTKVDLVISSSGLKCLLNNIDPTYSNSWLLPVVIKSHNGKNVIYVDKRLPPAIASVPHKNTWVYKYILRYCFVNTNKDNSSPKRAKQDKFDKSAVHSDKKECKKSRDKPLKIAKICSRRQKDKSKKAAAGSEEGECSDSSNEYFEVAKENELKEAAVYLDNDDDESNDSTGRLKIDESNISLSSMSSTELEWDPTHMNPEVSNKQNVSYRLFTIETQSQDERRDIKGYKILVRSKSDGVEALPDGGSRPLILSPKMEHQLGLGAEAATLEEGLHEWTSLTFKPEAFLARVRIDANNAEVIQIERHTAASMNSEIKRLHNVKAEDSLKILYNVIEKLSVLTPGRYIIQHTPKHGPFAHAYKKTEIIENIVLNLDTVYETREFETSPNTSWPPIDTILTTPWIKYIKKMPAMFNPNVNPSQDLSQMCSRPRGRPRKDKFNPNVKRLQEPRRPRGRPRKNAFKKD